MADDLQDAIRENAQGPAKAAGDSGSMEQHKLRGLVLNKFVPPGTE
jgi:hypothetical protein